MRSRNIAALILVLGAIASEVDALDIVRDAKPAATIVIVKTPTAQESAVYKAGFDATGEATSGKKAKAAKAPKKGAPALGPDGEAAELLVLWIKKMTGATLAIAETAPDNQPVILLGLAAQRAGLKLNDIQCTGSEAVRLRLEGNKVLISGQRPEATFKAACRFLEELGCRVFMDGDIGEVYPRQAALVLDKLDVTEKPAFVYRRANGPNWTKSTLFKTWNGVSSTVMGHSHSWGSYVSPSVFEKHPEYFAQRKDGQRVANGWLCTSNPELRQYFAEQVIARIKSGTLHPSLSPTDGTAYCQCEKCKAQDDPKAIEPSSGALSMSNRYVDFFNDVGARVAKVYPKSILSFYVYADYTQPPTLRKDPLSPNLCAFIAPIRYCRLHGIGCTTCPQRVQQEQMIDGWAKIASKLGYYMYMYDLAEATMPMSMISRLKHDIPYLHKHGCVGMNQEVLSNWYIYGPSLYLSQRLMYNPEADADAIMEDYYQKFYGSKAAPFMKEYWMAVDDAVAKAACHSGSFFWIPTVYTPELLTRLGKSIDRAVLAAKDEPQYAQRVALHAAGYQGAVDYRILWEATNRGDFAQAKKLYDAFISRIDALSAKGWANREYGTAYMRRFNSKAIAMGEKLLAPPNRLLHVLPDSWRMTYDPDWKGIDKKYFDTNYDDAGWKTVATYTKTLSAQGLLDRTEALWYRTSFEVPKSQDRLSLFFGEIDGKADIFVNGKQINPPEGKAPAKKKDAGKKKKGAPPEAKLPAAKDGEPNVDGAPKAAEPAPGFPKRAPFEVDVTEFVHPGRNIIAVRVDHTRITDLNLGGIIRPVYLIEKKKKQE